MKFFWFQRTGGEEAWHEALSEHRSRIITETKPAFVTVLDAHSVPEDGWGRDEYAKMRYSGPLYFDWDAEDLAETIPPFQEFLEKLKELSVNLRCLRLYATGGRGFHVEIPEGTFMPKVPANGVAQLPYIYKEMAMELVVDKMDMRVYTGRKGRMWRTPGVKRDNGLYKVPLTLDQALAITVESYKELCAEPRPEYERAPAELNPAMAAMFAKCQAKIDSAVKNRAKAGKDEELLARFKGDFPPSIKRLMDGENLLPGVGFHQIAMQLAITANALGKSSDDLVEMCKGLVKNHQGDSSRYGSPRKRKEELRRMWEYTHDNPCYGYSRGAIRNLMAPGAPTGDLDGVGESVGVGHVPDSDDDNLPADLAEEVGAAQNSLLEGLMVTNDGVYKRTAEGARMISNLSFRKPALMVDAADGSPLGLEVDIHADSKSYGRRLIDIKAFNSRTNLNSFCSGHGGIFSGTDTQASVVQLMLTRSAHKGDRVIYVVRKEGLDVIQDPIVKDEAKRVVLWVGNDRVITEASPVTYRFKSQVANEPVFNTDIHNIGTDKMLQDTEDHRAWLHALLNINSPVVVAQMLGWFVSCFHKQFYQHGYTQFPLLHPNGPAGSGKSLSTTLMAKMFHNSTPPKILGCSQQSTTNFSLKSAWTGSASVPLILDEYKPSEIGAQRLDFLLQHFRIVYNQGTGASGGIGKGGAESSFRDIVQYTYSAPTVFMGESQEMQTAIMQRSLPIAFNPGESKRHTPHFDHAYAGIDNMPKLGAMLLRFSLQETVESRREALDPIRASLRQSQDARVHDRQVFNLAVVLAGLEFLNKVLSSVYGEHFRGEIDGLRESLFTHQADINTVVMGEFAKVLNDMSLMSRTEDFDSEFGLKEGRDYAIGDGYLELLLRESYVRYFAWSKRKGFTPLYTSSDSFINASGKFAATTDRLCLDSGLRANNPQSRVVRFSLEKLAAEGVEAFKSRHGA